LVELIIVIAIMAILIGILAPNLMRYIERTNVSADTQVIDALRTAMITAIADPNNRTQHVGALTSALSTAGTAGASLATMMTAGSDVAADIAETLQLSTTGTDASGATIMGELRDQFRSTPANGGSEANVLILAGMSNGGNIIIRINPSDKTGARRGTVSSEDLITVGVFD
jgi:type II secretory pathway pseudopilin PulG